MKRTILLLLLFSQLLCFGQRSGRRISSANSVYTSYNEPTFSGQRFNITLISNDTTPTLLRLGPGKKIENSDTVTLARIYPCNNQGREYYDLDYNVGWENNCIRWYTLQFLNPGDSVQFTVKLKDFAEGDSTRLYFCFTKEVTTTDKDLKLYADPKTIYIMKDGRDFETAYINLSKTEPRRIVIGCE